MKSMIRFRLGTTILCPLTPMRPRRPASILSLAFRPVLLSFQQLTTIKFCNLFVLITIRNGGGVGTPRLNFPAFFPIWNSISRALGALLCLALLLPSAHAQQKAPSSNNAPGIAVVESSEELHETLQEKPALTFGPMRTPNLTITVNDAVKYQQIDGFGASLTDSSAWLLWNKLTEAQRKEALQMLFSPSKGIGLSVLRQPMGASDFALSPYSYDDLPPGQPSSLGDPDLKHFSIDHDRAYILPILREALTLNPNLKIIASPWSPPGWMKTSGSMIQGALLPTAYAPLARYFVQFVKEYEAAGIPIYAITMQNEPMNVPNDYPGMIMSAREQAAVLANDLGPAFREARLKTKIMVFDHNWDLIEYPVEVLSDSKAAAFAAGTATHCYGGSVTAQNELHERFPGMDIWLTECSGGDWQTGKLLPQQVRLVIGATRNWAKSVVLWNLALDQNHAPFLGGCTTCRGVITVNHSSQPSQVVPTVDYTALAHASKFVIPGAYRVESNTFDEGSLEDVAFRNPDGSLVLLVLNASGSSITFNIGWAEKFAVYKLPSGAVATFRWNSTDAAH
jgi:glucosylceramidase